MASELEIEDKRVFFLADYVLKTLRMTKGDRWVKMYQLEDQRVIIHDFLDKNDNMQLFIIATPSGGLQAQYNTPNILKSKGCFFFRKGKEAIGKDAQMAKVLTYGDLSYNPLDQFAGFVDEVLLPVLSNEKNNGAWPYVVSQDIIKQIHQLKQHTEVILGHSQGKTHLPMPVGGEKIDEVNESLQESSQPPAAEGEAEADQGMPKPTPEIDWSLVYAIETVVIDWTHQIHEILRKDSAQELLDGKNPLPSTEINFWSRKSANLEYVYEQLTSSKVQKMGHILEAVNSSYSPPFKDMFRSVVAALYEAQDISLHLKPLNDFLSDLEQAEFDECQKQIGPVFHVLCLIWANSRYYRVPARIIVMLQEICNLFIKMCHDFLDPSEVFKGEVEETVTKVKKALTILEAFKATFEEYRGKVKDYFKGGEPMEWDFANTLVFARYDAFMERVKMVADIMETAVEFLKLEKVEYGGMKGRGLSKLTMDIFEEFNNHYKVFSDKSYDVLDPLNKEFLDDYNQFHQQIVDIDRRLASIVCQAFDDCSGPESAFRLIDILSTLVERPLIKAEFDQKYPLLIQMLDKEMDNAKEIYDWQLQRIEDTNYAMVHKNVPQVTGRLKWASELKKRITLPMDNLKHVEHP